MNSKNKIIPVIIVILIMAIGIFGAYYYSRSKYYGQVENNNIDTNILAELNAACQSYYDNFNNTKDFLSVYSFLYDDQLSATVEVDNLVKMGYLKSSENIEKVMILYVKPEDLSDYIDFGDINKQELTLFTAFENKDGVMVSLCSDNKSALLTKEQFRDVTLKYDFNRGEIRNPEKSTKEYDLIVDSIKGYDKKDEEINIKHIACNDLYASVVFVYGNNFDDIREYILMKDNNVWNVVIKDLEKESKYRVVVNQEYPDFELGLLPIYNLNDYYGKIKTEFDDIVNLLVQQSIIDKNDVPPVYSCGVGEFIYFEFKSGKKLVGYVNAEGELQFHNGENYEEAVAYMVQINKKPPLFILNK